MGFYIREEDILHSYRSEKLKSLAPKSFWLWWEEMNDYKHPGQQPASNLYIFTSAFLSHSIRYFYRSCVKSWCFEYVHILTP
jgi:hypothetical protein